MELELRDSVISRCNLCAHAGRFTLLAMHKGETDSLEELVGKHAQRMTVCCPNCGWTFKPGRLSDVQLRALYKKQGGSATVNSSTHFALEARSLNVKQYIEAAAGKEVSHVRVLDIGGGAGQVSFAFAEANCVVEVLDVSGAIPLHPSILVRNTSFDEFSTEQQYDIIIMSHVLEHTWTPREWLQKAEGLLRPDGILFVEVPFELYTPYVKAKLGDPCHVGYFGKGTLSDFLVAANLEMLSLVRTLAIYDNRRVMALRAVCKRKSAENVTVPGIRRRGALHAFAEMFNPHQMVLMALRR